MRLTLKKPLRSLILAFCAAVAQQAVAQSLPANLAAAIAQGRVEVVDLTHELDSQSPYWPEGNVPSPFKASAAATYEKDGYFARSLEMPEHFGTHMDAPAHFDKNGAKIDRIPVRDLILPAEVVDVSEPVRANAEYRVTAADIENWQKSHGVIPRGSLVIFRTGWESRWPSQARYMNRDAEGVMHFPGLSVEAAKLLADSIHAAAIGIDTASIDYGPSKNFEAHHVTMPAGLYHLENLANLGRLPATGAVVMALPLKLRDGSGSPTRVVALLEK